MDAGFNLFEWAIGIMALLTVGVLACCLMVFVVGSTWRWIRRGDVAGGQCRCNSVFPFRKEEHFRNPPPGPKPEVTATGQRLRHPGPNSSSYIPTPPVPPPHGPEVNDGSDWPGRSVRCGKERS